MPTSEEQEYQEYLDYLDYQKHLAGQSSPVVNQEAPLEEVKKKPEFWSKESWDNSAKQLQSDLNNPDKLKESANLAGSLLGAGMPQIGQGATSGLARFLGRTGSEALLGAAQNEDDRLKGAGIGALGSAGGELASKALGKVGDVAMQAAVGRKKYTPGVGLKLADEGLIGTKGMMADQVASRLSDAGNTLSKTAADIPGTPIDSSQVAQNIWDKISKSRLSGVGIKPSAADLPELNQMASYVEDIASRGPLTAESGVGYSRAAGNRAYGLRDVAGATTPKQLAKLEQVEMSNAIKNADKTGEYAKAADLYSALKKAEKGLTEEVSIPRSLMGLASLPANALPFISAIPSTVGQVASKASKAAPIVGKGLSRKQNTSNKK